MTPCVCPTYFKDSLARGRDLGRGDVSLSKTFLERWDATSGRDLSQMDRSYSLQCIGNKVSVC